MKKPSRDNRIKRLRLGRNMAQWQTAEALGICTASYNKKERGNTPFNEHEILKLIKLFGASFDDMFGSGSDV